MFYITAIVRPIGRRVRVSRPLSREQAEKDAKELKRMIRRQKPSLRYYAAVKIEES